MAPSVTLCLTIGNRPEQLRQTLTSLLARASFDDVIAVNDFRDEPTNAAFRELCPGGQLVLMDEQVGHHRAVDAMYERIRTPYVFHCEDDWWFDAPCDLDAAEALLQHPQASIVCFRKVTDALFDKPRHFKAKPFVHQGQKGLRLDHLNKHWHAFTFNPHLARLDLWKQLGNFSRFASEKEISQTLRAQGRYVVYADPGACHHIGDGVSVSGTNKKSMSKRVKAWLRTKFPPA